MKYEVEQYETVKRKYVVEAISEAEAIKKVVDGKVFTMALAEHVEIDEERGMSVEEVSSETAEELVDLAVTYSPHEGYIPSIASIKEIG